MKGRILFLCLILFNLGALKAYEDVPKCFTNLEVNFFNRHDVFQALEMFPIMIDQGTWPQIYTDLVRKSQKVHEYVKSSAENQNPNPLEYPFNAKKSLEILQLTLYSIFQETITKWTVQRFEGATQNMFDFLMEQKSNEWNQCLLSKSRTN